MAAILFLTDETDRSIFWIGGREAQSDIRNSRHVLLLKGGEASTTEDRHTWAISSWEMPSLAKRVSISISATVHLIPRVVLVFCEAEKVSRVFFNQMLAAWDTYS